MLSPTSSELIKLGGQQLLPVPWTNNNIYVTKRLQLLKAHAWFNLATE